MIFGYSIQLRGSNKQELSRLFLIHPSLYAMRVKYAVGRIQFANGKACSFVIPTQAKDGLRGESV